jgi:hypothetical protein
MQPDLARRGVHGQVDDGPAGVARRRGVEPQLERLGHRLDRTVLEAHRVPDLSSSSHARKREQTNDHRGRTPNRHPERRYESHGK